MKKLLAVLFILISVLPAHAEDNALQIAGVTENHPAYKKIIEVHPDIRVKAVGNPYLNTEILINAFLSGGFEYDIYCVNSNSFDVQRLIEKGYCTDISSNTEIKSLVDRIYPAIADQLRYEEGIFGVPYGCTFYYLTYRSNEWREIGLTEDEVPITFADFLDFMEEWIYEIQPQQEDVFCIISSFDETVYNENSYTDWLVELLLDHYIMQSNYAGVPLRFSDPTFMTLLDRCLTTGKALYELEPEPNVGMPLFETTQGISGLRQIVPLMLTNEQPPLIRMNIGIAMVYAKADAPTLSEEFLLYLLDSNVSLSEWDRAYLFIDCPPIENESYDAQVQQWQEMVQEIERRLSDPSSRDDVDEAELETTLVRYQNILESVSSESNKYIVSAEMLDLYRTYSDYFYIQPPHIFHPGTPENETVKNIQQQLVEGAISVDQFVKRLDEMAWMIELERS